MRTDMSHRSSDVRHRQTGMSQDAVSVFFWTGRVRASVSCAGAITLVRGLLDFKGDWD